MTVRIPVTAQLNNSLIETVTTMSFKYSSGEAFKRVEVLYGSCQALS